MIMVSCIAVPEFSHHRQLIRKHSYDGLGKVALKGELSLSWSIMIDEVTHLVVDKELGMEEWFGSICTVRGSSSCTHDGREMEGNF